MRYHVLLKTKETGDLYEFDNDRLEDVKKLVIEPYLKDQEFQFDGYFIEPSKVRRLVVSETRLPADECLNDAYNRLDRSIIMVIDKEDCVFGDERYSKDITKQTLQDVKSALEQNAHTGKKSEQQKINNKDVDSPPTIFLSYSYRQIDAEFVSGFKELLVHKGYEVIDGKADGLGSISEAVIEKIALSDIVVIMMTKRDKKENQKFTTSAWLLEEKGAALALNKKVVMFVEEEIDDSDIGGMQGDNQRFHFTRNNFLNVAMNFLRILEKERAIVSTE